jgi:lincosamide nucleotidyltransferase
VLKQMELINRVRLLCERDNDITSALMYGSFVKGKGDSFSDIEFAVFFTEECYKSLDEEKWLNQIAAVLLNYKNEFGITEVIFDGLIRGEFHFEPNSNVSQVSMWKSTDWFPSLESALIVDKTGELTSHLYQLIGDAPLNEFKKQAQSIINCYTGWLISGYDVLKRGELARAHCLLWWIQWKLLHMIRLLEEKFENWGTPSRELEKDISSEFYAEFTSCTSDIIKNHLELAYTNAWRFGRKLMDALKAQYNVNLPVELVKQLDQYFNI